MNPVRDFIVRFLYTPAITTQSVPHVRDALNLKRIMVIVLFSLIPALFMALYNTGFQANLSYEQIGSTSVTTLLKLSPRHTHPTTHAKLMFVVCALLSPTRCPSLRWWWRCVWRESTMLNFIKLNRIIPDQKYSAMG